MNTELSEILDTFAISQWDLISVPSLKHLKGEDNTAELINAIREADDQCGCCGCEYDALYKRALIILQEK